MKSTTNEIPSSIKDGDTNLEETSISLQDAYEYIELWRKRLKLGDMWRIDISKLEPEDPKHYMEIFTYPARLTVAIRISPQAYKLPRKKFEELIVHELVHIIVESINEEHKIQSKYWIDRAGPEYNLPFRMRSKDQEYKDYRDRMMYHIERSVEHLSRIIYSAYSE